MRDRRVIPRIKEQLMSTLESWGIATPYNIAVRYDIRLLAYHVRITFTEGMTCVDWLVDEDGVFEDWVEQLAADARIPIAEEL